MTTKRCPICDMEFPSTADMASIVKHSASCVHFYCDKNGVDYCWCRSCTGNYKLSQTEVSFKWDVLLAQLIEPLSSSLRPKDYLKVATLSRAAFTQVKPYVESKHTFNLHGSFKYYEPIFLVATNLEQFSKMPKSAKSVHFIAGMFTSLYSPQVEHIPNLDVVTRVTIRRFFGIANNVSILTSLPTSLETLTMENNTEPVVKVPILPPSLRVLITERNFELAELPSKLERLSYTRSNVPLPDVMPDSLKVLELDLYNHPITFPPNLEKLSLGSQFTLPLQNLPLTLLKLKLGHHNNALLSLPPKLMHLDTGLKYNHSLPNLPSTLKHLTIGNAFEQHLPSLPSSLQVLEILSAFSIGLPQLPNNLSTLYIGDRFSGPLPQLPSSIVSLRLGASYNRPLTAIPACLQSLVCNSRIAPEILPTGLKYLELNVNCQALTILPSGLRLSVNKNNLVV